MSSSRKPSTAPTDTSAGGSPERSVARAGAAVAGTSWTMSNNYFTAPNGKIVTQWPYGNTQYRVLTKLLGRVSEVTRRRVG